MEWTLGFTAVFIGACVAAILMLTNMIFAYRYGEAKHVISIAMYLVGFATVFGNILYIYGSTTKTILAANLIALLCMGVSMRRCVAGHKALRKEGSDNE